MRRARGSVAHMFMLKWHRSAQRRTAMPSLMLRWRAAERSKPNNHRQVGNSPTGNMADMVIR